MDRLTLTDVSKVYGNTRVVDRLSLSLRAGEFVSLLGSSGCGKTTTLRMIAGFVPLSSGSIEADGRTLSKRDAALPPERRNMSMIFQSYALWPNMTVAQNVAFGLRMRKVPRGLRKGRVNEILEVVKLGHLGSRYPSELSGGQQQRVALARALVVRPNVLLLDEPLSNLDTNLREEMRSEIRRLHNEFGTTSVYVTHDQAEAMATSDRIAVMNKGRIEQIDPPLTLYTRPRTRYVAEFLGSSNILMARVVGQSLCFAGFDIDRGRIDAGSPFETSTFSFRPQNGKLHSEPPGRDAILLPGRIAERSFLGESWDYRFHADAGDLRVRVLAAPLELFADGQQVWLEIDPAHIVPLEEEAQART